MHLYVIVSMSVCLLVICNVHIIITNFCMSVMCTLISAFYRGTENCCKLLYNMTFDDLEIKTNLSMKILHGITVFFVFYEVCVSSPVTKAARAECVLYVFYMDFVYEE